MWPFRGGLSRRHAYEGWPRSPVENAEAHPLTLCIGALLAMAYAVVF